MALYSALQLEKLARDIFVGVGTPADIADHVAKSLVTSNLMGHDAHGILRIPQYLEAIEKKTCLLCARPAIIRETASTAVIDGNWAFGQLTASFAARVAIEKAKNCQVAAVSLVRCNHIGRLGEYTELATKEGMVAFMVGGTYNGPSVTPYGGATRVMGTNPISIAVPGNEDPVIADIATSVTAEGKLRVAKAKRQALAPGIIVDRDGRNSTDPDDFYDGGALLTFGGHKGYVLSVVIDLIGRHVTGGDGLVTDHISFGNLFTVINIEAFRPLAEYRMMVEKRLQEIKGATPAPGFTEIMLPGEPERRTLAQRTQSGVDIPQEIWSDLAHIANRLGVSMPMPLS